MKEIAVNCNIKQKPSFRFIAIVRAKVKSCLNEKRLQLPVTLTEYDKNKMFCYNAVDTMRYYTTNKHIHIHSK